MKGTLRLVTRAVVHAIAVAACISCSGSIGEVSQGSAAELPQRGGGGVGFPAVVRMVEGKGTSNGTRGGSSGSSGPHVGMSTLRLLSHREYDRTIDQLLATVASPASAFVSQGRQLGYTNSVDILAVSSALAQQYGASAASLASSAVVQLALDECPSGDKLACARGAISKFGLRAYRRPLAPSEVDAYAQLYTGEAASSDHTHGVAFVVETMLQSPYFLYRFEQGPSLSPFDLATALSYAILGTSPDDMLLAKASDGALDTAATLEGEAERLLALPAAESAFDAFIQEWLEIDDLATLPKDPRVYPMYDATLRSSMLAETSSLLSHVWYERRGSFGELLTANYTYADDRLAMLYGLPSGAHGAPVPLRADERIGVLLQASFLAKHAKPTESFPISRGKFFRQRLLCNDLPPPPQNVRIVPPAPDPTLTTRERFAQHSVEPLCRSCHGLIDPPGFAFERFDGIGAYRATENGRSIDDTGSLTGTGDLDGVFAGGIDLVRKMASSREVHACFVTQVFRYTMGRREAATDAPTLDAVAAKFEGTSLDMKQVLLGIVTDPGFQSRIEP